MVYNIMQLEEKIKQAIMKCESTQKMLMTDNLDARIKDMLILYLSRTYNEIDRMQLELWIEKKKKERGG